MEKYTYAFIKGNLRDRAGAASRVRSGFLKHLYDVSLLLSGRQGERRLSLFGLRIHLRAMVQQDLYDLSASAARGHHQSGPPLLAPFVDIGPTLQERLDQR